MFQPAPFQGARKRYGPYESREAPVEAAIDAVYAMGEIGIDAQVAVEDLKFQVQTAWAYDGDFKELR